MAASVHRRRDVPGAMRIHFNNFRLPANAGVYLYTEDGQAFDPIPGAARTGRRFLVAHRDGRRSQLQLRYLGQASDADLRATSFRVAGSVTAAPPCQSCSTTPVHRRPRLRIGVDPDVTRPSWRWRTCNGSRGRISAPAASGDTDTGSAIPGS
jgi:hypothetical protein